MASFLGVLTWKNHPMNMPILVSETFWVFRELTDYNHGFVYRLRLMSQSQSRFQAGCLPITQNALCLRFICHAMDRSYVTILFVPVSRSPSIKVRRSLNFNQN